MRSRLLPVLVAGALSLPLVGQTVASADPREIPGPSRPGAASATAAEHASDALAAAQALFSEKSPANARRQVTSGRDATLVLNELIRVRDDLSPAERKVADRLLARPTDGADDPEGDGYTVEEAPPVCSLDAETPICVHYVATTDDAPPNEPTDDVNPANGVPDEVDRALATAEHVHTTYADAGYRRPDPDGTTGGGTDMVDIYLADVGAQGLYGYCTSDVQEPTTFNLPAYCVIDDDFAEFPTNTAEENQQVTLAHEYFHAVQFAYDAFEDLWILEATAVWAEEQLYDDIDDNRQFLEDGQLKQPLVPLDASGGFAQYGNWVFIQYLTERWSAETGTMPTLVLDLWKRMDATTGAPDLFSTQALQRVLTQRNRSFTTVYGQFADANRRPATTYEEGDARAYRPVRPTRMWTLSGARRTIGPWFVRLDHLTSVSWRFKPAAELTRRDWRIRVKVDMPPSRSAPVARVTTYLKSGRVDTGAIRLKATGASTKVLGFSARRVRYVELVLVNASRRSRCWTGDGTYACAGTPIDNGKRTDFTASIFRS